MKERICTIIPMRSTRHIRINKVKLIQLPVISIPVSREITRKFNNTCTINAVIRNRELFIGAGSLVL
jgi:hypothetical protein